MGMGASSWLFAVSIVGWSLKRSVSDTPLRRSTIRSACTSASTALPGILPPTRKSSPGLPCSDDDRCRLFGRFGLEYTFERELEACFRCVVSGGRGRVFRVAEQVVRRDVRDAERGFGAGFDTGLRVRQRRGRRAGNEVPARGRKGIGDTDDDQDFRGFDESVGETMHSRGTRGWRGF